MIKYIYTINKKEYGMKTKILFAFLMLCLIFTFSTVIYANETECTHNYLTTALSFEDDFCLNGGTRTLTCEACGDEKTEYFGNFATLIGYSASNTSIVGTYSISSQALKEYASLNKLKLNYGFIVASQTTVESYGNPVSPQTGYVGNNMIKYDMLYNSSVIQDVVISNVKEDVNAAQSPLDKMLFISYYVLIGDKVYYIQDRVMESYTDFFYCSHNMLKQSIDSFNGFSKEETELSKDRLNQMESSKFSFNTGADLTESELDTVLKAAELISLGGVVFNFPNASLMLSHFLSCDGSDYNMDFGILFSDKTALANRNKDINSALYACEVLAEQGKTLSFNQKVESLHHNLTGDFWYAMGSYFTRIEITNLTVSFNKNGEKVYSASIKYIVEDFYNFDASDTSDIFPSISPYELNQLHKAGIAKEFLTHGEKTYNLIWTEGQRIEDLKV